MSDPVRERILREATRLFAAHGYDGTSIQAVAAAAGVTRPTLVYHFASKDGLRDEVLGRLFAHWTAELPRLLSASAKGPRLEALIDNLYDFFSAEPALARLVLREALDRPDELHARIRAHLHPFTALFVELVRVGQAGGWIRTDTDPEAFIALLVASVVGVVAVGQSSGALLPGAPDSEAQRRELARMARLALMRDGGRE